MVKRLRPDEIPDPNDSYSPWVGLSPGYKRAAGEEERARRAEQARREAAERARAEQARREQEAREEAERARVREAAERLWMEQERIRKRREIIESWSRPFIRYRESSDAAAARFVFKKLGLDLYDDNVGEKFFDRFWGSPFFKSRTEIDEKAGFFIHTITDNFDGYQLNRYKKMIDHMIRIFEGSMHDVKSGIQNRIDSMSPLNWAIARTKDENITQGVKEFFSR